MRALGLILLLVALPATAQTTTQCTRNGAVTNCTTTPDQPSWTTLLPKPPTDRDQPKNNASETLDVQATMLRREERRREAYNQVGAVIARGDCPAAKRLAEFYGAAELINATAKACPN